MLGTLTSTAIKQARDVMSTHKVLFFDYTGPNAAAGGYPTGGDSIVPNDVGLGNIDFIDVASLSSGSAVRIASYDRTNQKLQLFVPNTGSEVANATDVSTFSGRIMVVGQ